MAWLPFGAERVAENCKNLHPRDRKVCFTDNAESGLHRYWILGATEHQTRALSANLVSVSGVIGKFGHEFDAPAVARRMASKGNLRKNPKYAELAASVPQAEWAKALEQKWAEDGEEARTLGKEMHACLEDQINGDPLRFAVSKEYGYGLAVLDQLHREQQLIPYRAEWRVYFPDNFPDVPTASIYSSPPPPPGTQPCNQTQAMCWFVKQQLAEFLQRGLRLCGSIDLVLANENQVADGTVREVVLADWKRAKEIKVINNFDRMKSDLSSFTSSNYNEYTLQLNLYKFILEHFYGLKVLKMMLLICHPDQEEALVVDVEDRQAAVWLMLNRRAQELQTLARELALENSG